ncbi:hypothetical protein FB45DRAFT_1002481 [Roridomyces roridus]|uniref:Uncharacterized protein n=1 Tax=Roridomyces roridus TaxID=1738132 RepID=A0AAD7BZW6_9AGAR|nr:hypothetical protein FB45DRAFT_1002481 [Roridomyces roridus]
MSDIEKQLLNSTQAVPESMSSPTFASLSLHEYDRIRLLDFPPEIIATLRTTITSHWPYGLQSETPDYHGGHEFKLRGNPWRGAGTDGVFCRRLILRLLKALHRTGLVQAHGPRYTRIPLARPGGGGREGGPGLDVHALSKGDKLKLIDAPEDLRKAVIDIAGRTGMLQRHQPYQGAGDAYEIKLLGYPWHARGGDTMVARRFVLALMGVLEGNGWSVYASIDQIVAPEDGATSTRGIV